MLDFSWWIYNSSKQKLKCYGRFWGANWLFGSKISKTYNLQKRYYYASISIIERVMADLLISELYNQILCGDLFLILLDFSLRIYNLSKQKRKFLCQILRRDLAFQNYQKHITSINGVIISLYLLLSRLWPIYRFQNFTTRISGSDF